MSASATESSTMWSAGVTGDIATLLRACVGTIVSVESSEWRLIGADTSAITVRIESGWLVLRKPLRSASDSGEVRPWDLLSQNAGLCGGVKCSFVPSEGIVELCAEIPLDGDVEARVRQVCGFMWAKDAARAERDAAEASDKSDDALTDLGQLCADAGWLFNARPDGSLAVELMAPETYGVARVVRRENGAVQVSIDVANAAEAVLPVCRAALAGFMLRVNEVVRFVRVVARLSRDEAILRLEVVFATPPSATELDHALAALSVAWGMCSREAEVLLGDELIAKAYLERSPWSLVPGP